MTHGSLFSGIGGFDLAAEWMGWENVFHCEINEFCQRVLKYYWPNATSYHDIKQTDFTIWRGKVDVLSGGFPCQPWSTAGKRAGKADDRHLWPEMLRAIREIQPRWIVGENVYGIVNWSRGVVFEEVQTDLENEGYDTQAYVLPACAKNALHRRDRCWFVANASSQRNALYDSGVNNNEKQYRKSKIQKQEQPRGAKSYAYDNAANSINDRLERELRKDSREKNGAFETLPSLLLCQDQEQLPKPYVTFSDDGLPVGLDTKAIRRTKWRTESIKAYGNAIVPQVAFEIFKAIKSIENI